MKRENITGERVGIDKTSKRKSLRRVCVCVCVMLGWVRGYRNKISKIGIKSVLKLRQAGYKVGSQC